MSDENTSFVASHLRAAAAQLEEEAKELLALAKQQRDEADRLSPPPNVQLS